MVGLCAAVGILLVVRGSDQDLIKPDEGLVVAVHMIPET